MGADHFVGWLEVVGFMRRNSFANIVQNGACPPGNMAGDITIERIDDVNNLMR